MPIVAIGCSWDTDYVFGDNIHWRGLKDSMAQSNFEGEELYTTSDSITFIDTDNSDANCTATIIPSFDEYKKILQLYDNNAAGNVEIINTLSSSQVSGTIEFCIEISDATKNAFVQLIDGATDAALNLRILTENLYQSETGGWTQICTILDNTRYHIKIDFECGAGAYKGLAADTLYIWVNNVRYGPYDFDVAIASVTDLLIKTGAAKTNYYVYLDAFGFSWETDYEEADNRLLEYHALSKLDITATCSDLLLTCPGNTYRTVSLQTTTTLYDNHTLEIYDVNSDLRFIGNHFRDVDAGIGLNGYIYHSLNKVEIEKESSYTASAPERINASMLGILTNVDQTDGRLIYYTKDNPAGNLTPDYLNKPIKIIKVFFDADADPDNGAATITATSSNLMGIPTIDKVSHQINYVEVRGAINPNTGAPFYGVSEDTTAQADGTGIIPYYKRDRSLNSDADCLALATALRTSSGFTPNIINVPLRGIYADPNEVINFAYADKSFTATDCFVDLVRFNMLTGRGDYVLNTGMIDPVTFNAPGYTEADEASDNINKTLYNTDIIEVVISPYATGGATTSLASVFLDAVNEIAGFQFYIEIRTDVTRDIIIEVPFKRNDANADTIDIDKTLSHIICDGDDAGDSLWLGVADTLPACAVNKYYYKTFTIPANTLTARSHVIFSITMNEAGREVYILPSKLIYYQKREV